MRMLEHRIPPPLVALLVGAAMAALAEVGPVFTLPVLARVAVCGALIVAAAALEIGGLIAFRAQRTTVNPMRPERASTLVTGGVYRITRNPMYLGLALLLLAWAVYLGAALAFAGVPVFMAYITRFQIAPEERALQARFGEAFTHYATQVRRWL